MKALALLALLALAGCVRIDRVCIGAVGANACPPEASAP
jgi:hypothetical protein